MPWLPDHCNTEEGAERWSFIDFLDTLPEEEMQLSIVATQAQPLDIMKCTQ